MIDFEREPSKPITARAEKTAGALWLAGWADARAGRPAVIHQGKRARAAYLAGYQAGKQDRRD